MPEFSWDLLFSVLSKTRIGSIAIAAADDISAWCILAAVITIVNAGSSYSALVTMLLTPVYVLIMYKVVKPLLVKITRSYASNESMSLAMASLMFGVLLISSCLTEIIGIHALFGAFLAGVIMPSRLNFRNVLAGKVAHVSIGLLLPLFFAFSGLRTQIGFLDTADAWMICGIITGIAILGKFSGSMLAAKVVGETWKDGFTLGALINTRGLMELVVLNIGFELRVLNAALFTMMVLMALVTTFMTGPALDLTNRSSKIELDKKYKQLQT